MRLKADASSISSSAVVAHIDILCATTALLVLFSSQVINFVTKLGQVCGKEIVFKSGF